ncbi:putative nuclease HARBI1, partial [Musca vetustissima]|uniref:putative nuclease HARBI1 n=1 Tax=Musca vetustissima TaxID=27455 RepID=UPI002AB65126
MRQEEIGSSKKHFFQKHGIPGVVGCVDGTHIRVTKPNDEVLYYNRKGYFSVNVMVVCDYQMKIKAVDASKPGSCHDSFVWLVSNAKNYYKDLYANGRNCWLLGDSGYGLEPYIITPYRNPEFNTVEHRFNRRHCAARNIVERTIGNLKSRFRCLQMALPYTPLKVSQIVNVCCSLHNICKHFNLPMDEEVVIPSSSDDDSETAE